MEEPSYQMQNLPSNYSTPASPVKSYPQALNNNMSSHYYSTTSEASVHKPQSMKTQHCGYDLSNPQYRKIFVGGLPHNLEQSQFREYFSQFGTLEDCVIVKDK